MSSLVKLSEASVSNVGSVTLTGITSAFNVAVVYYSNVVPANDGADLQFQFTQSGTANGNSNYQALLSYPRSDRSFITNSGDNIAVAGRDRVHLTGSTSNVSTTGSMGQIYITSAADSSEITYANIETAYATDGSTKILIGEVAGAVLKETTAVDGIKIFFDSGNITSGDFVMYAIKE